MKRIILTGGGTAGHVTPNIALIPKLRELGFDIHYIGSYNGIEKDLIEPFGIPYHGISSGKLRRYFSLQNFTDPFRVIKGFGEARKLIKNLKPDVIFSKGGFVSVPVVLAVKSQFRPQQKYAVIFLKHWIAFRKGKPSLQVLRFDRNFSQAIKSQQWISANSLQINLLSS